MYNDVWNLSIKDSFIFRLYIICFYSFILCQFPTPLQKQQD